MIADAWEDRRAIPQCVFLVKPLQVNTTGQTRSRSRCRRASAPRRWGGSFSWTAMSAARTRPAPPARRERPIAGAGRWCHRSLRHLWSVGSPPQHLRLWGTSILALSHTRALVYLCTSVLYRFFLRTSVPQHFHTRIDWSACILAHLEVCVYAYLKARILAQFHPCILASSNTSMTAYKMSCILANRCTWTLGYFHCWALAYQHAWILASL